MDAIESYDFNKEYTYYFTHCYSAKCRYFTKLMWLIIREKIFLNEHEKIIRHLKKKNLKKLMIEMKMDGQH